MNIVRPNDEIRVGGEIESYCTKCRRTTTHRVVSMKDDKPKTVSCLSCGGQHLFRKPPDEGQEAAPVKVKKVAVKKSPVKKSAVAAAAAAAVGEDAGLAADLSSLDEELGAGVGDPFDEILDGDAPAVAKKGAKAAKPKAVKAPKAPKAPKEPKAPRVAKNTKEAKELRRKEDEKDSLQKEWRDKSERLDLAKIPAYDVTGSFDRDQAINHATFGMGFVVKVIPPNKIVVNFESGTRTLIMKVSS
ncbi:MAG: hypothetical protein LBO66_10890 [Deltaproteobacteria bacterium]|jgi:ribosomal protein L44E|nr:hypothetical protein [Deltaproteobacteria bacterium]